jgi:hypothetical protein
MSSWIVQCLRSSRVRRSVGPGCAFCIRFAVGAMLRVRGRRPRLLRGAQPGHRLCPQYEGRGRGCAPVQNAGARAGTQGTTGDRAVPKVLGFSPRLCSDAEGRRRSLVLGAQPRSRLCPAYQVAAECCALTQRLSRRASTYDTKLRPTGLRVCPRSIKPGVRSSAGLGFCRAKAHGPRNADASTLAQA